MTNTDTLTISFAVHLGMLLDACSRNAPCTWLPRCPDGELVGDGKTISGTLRRICGDDQGRGFIGSEMDVRDGYVWISATFEHFLPVRQVVDAINDGTFALDFRG